MMPNQKDGIDTPSSAPAIHRLSVRELRFTAEMMPEGVRHSALMNPLLHITELVRSAFFIEFESGYVDPGYVILFLLSAVFLGLVVQLALRRKIQSLPG